MNARIIFTIVALATSLGCEAAPDTASAAPPANPPNAPAAAAAKAEADVGTTEPGAEAKRSSGVTTFDLVDNRHLAHFDDGGIVLDLGHASGSKYVQGRWNAGWYDAGEDDGRKVGWPRGVSAVVRFPVLRAAELHRLTVRLKPNGKQFCDVFLSPADGDERKVGSFTQLGEGWGTHELELGKLEAGAEYTLRLHFSRSRDIPGGRRSAAAIDWIRVGADGASAEPRRRVDAFDVPSRTIALERGESLSWFTVLGKTPSLEGTFDGSGELVVHVEGTEPVRKPLGGKTAVDLSQWADTPVRLELVAGAKGLKAARPRLTAPHAAVRPRSKGPRVVLVWVIDTLRADHLPAYNPDTDVVTPNLDAFVEEAALFTNATVQGNSSLPTSASIFTGAYTVTHGLVRESGRLKADHRVLGEPFDAAGWSTALFSSNGYVSKTWGFARGFDKEVNPIRESRPSDTSVLWPEAKAWLEQALQSDEPILLYINTVDPHVPYDPPSKHLKRYHQGGRVGKVTPRGTGQLLHDAAGGKVTITNAERDYMLALYKGEITDNDEWFGTMRADLEALGIADQTMIVVTSDHGEEFGEYGRFGHGVSVNQELVDVPFIVGYTPWTKPGRRIDTAVEVIDLYPTIADAAGVETGAQVQGESLVRRMLDASPSHPTIAFSYHNDFLRGARVGNWKYQLFNGDNDRVYDLNDRDGVWDDENLAAERPITRRAMRDAMAFQVGFDMSWKKSVDGHVNNHTEAAAKRLDEQGW
jgi:arylsulfatase A-like enzyme